jgi:hypothetical protein
MAELNSEIQKKPSAKQIRLQAHARRVRFVPAIPSFPAGPGDVGRAGRAKKGRTHMNRHHRRPVREDRDRRITRGFIASAGLAAVLLCALHWARPSPKWESLDTMPPTSAIAAVHKDSHRSALVMGAAAMREDAALAGVRNDGTTADSREP